MDWINAIQIALHFSSNVLEATSKINMQKNIFERVKVPAVINLTCHSEALRRSQSGTRTIKLNRAY